MYRNRIQDTHTKSLGAKRLQSLLLEYHDFQLKAASPTLTHIIDELADWQTKRLKHTHHDLYTNNNFRDGIDFLLAELYGSEDFSARDRDLERVFPKLVKLLPDALLDTVANLIELNLLTQRLDFGIAEYLSRNGLSKPITEDNYLTAYRATATIEQRKRQLSLVQNAGNLLDKHARNPLLRLSLNMTRRPANRAGLGALHSFLQRGLDAFFAMDDVDILMQTLIDRESQILFRIYNNQEPAFKL